MSKRCLILPGAAVLTMAMLPLNAASPASAATRNAAAVVPVVDPYNAGYSIGYNDGLNCNRANFSSKKSTDWQDGYEDGHDQGTTDRNC